MRIRKKQMDALGAAVERRFEDEMIAHLDAFSPPLFKATGEEQMRQVIRLGISKAAAYGFENRGPVRLYLEMMLLFGSHFDTRILSIQGCRALLHGRGSALQKGSGYFPITIQWRVIGKATIHDFAAVRQEDEIFENGPCESRKGSHTEFTMHSDPASTY
jgi:hypothetical protein